MSDPAPRTTWHTTTSVRTWWGAAPADDQTLVDLLEIAKEQVVAFAPKLPVTEPPTTTIPTSYAFGQYRRAREMWESAKANPDDPESIGIGGMQIRVARMSGAIKMILRPEPAVPGIG